jgi:hypothetical protein
MAGSEEGFAVPEGYFDRLSASILDKTVNAEKQAGPLKIAADNRKGAVIRRLFHTTAFKYATAACLMLAIGGGVVLTQLGGPSNDHQHSFLHKQLSGVPINDIKAYLQLNVDAGDTQQAITTQGTSVNDKDLKEALQNYADSLQ